MDYILTRAQAMAAFDGSVGKADRIFKLGAAALELANELTDCTKTHTAAFFCGAGENGIVGLMAAIILSHKTHGVTVYIVGTPDSETAKIISGAKASGVTVRDESEYTESENVIIDAIHGIEYSTCLDSDTAKLIERLNAAKAFKVAADIPTGLDADSGIPDPVAFKADVTIAFACYKQGMLFGEGRNYCGDIIIDGMGIDVKSNCTVYNDSDFVPFKRSRTAHKVSVGRIFIIGGCGEMIGAPIMSAHAAHAAYLNGAGTVTMCAPKINKASLTSRAILSMTKFMPDTPDGFIKFDKRSLDSVISSAAAIDIGMGMGKAPDLKKIVMYLSENFDGNLVIDADGLNAIADDLSFIKNAKAKIALTPHVGEFGRLCDEPPTIENAKKFAKQTGCVLVLKSATTIITDGNEVRVNITGTPAMAKGGTGDILGGCITALSCSFPLFDAATVACYRNGMGAERAVSSYAQLMLTPRDMLRYAGYEELKDPE